MRKWIGIILIVLITIFIGYNYIYQAFKTIEISGLVSEDINALIKDC